ncbi:MAG: DUF971 domain-containing protein [Bryobacteraceae bacterium]
MTNDPQHIAISKSKGIIIDWKDGHRSEYSLRLLRDQCPCAGCTGAHGAAPNPFQMYQPAPAMLSVEPVGRYAIRINWNDGHNAGIYSYEHFRRICPCQECHGMTPENGAA